MTPDCADIEEDGLVFSLGARKGRFAPGVPLHRLMPRRAQVGGSRIFQRVRDVCEVVNFLWHALRINRRAIPREPIQIKCLPSLPRTSPRGEQARRTRRSAQSNENGLTTSWHEASKAGWRVRA